MMIDLALSILALIAGGLTLELFGSALPARHQEVQAFSLGSEEEFQGNPS